MRREDEFLESIQEQLDSGAYPPGSVLPSQRELAAEHGHDVRDVRAAMQRLESAGRIRIRRKAGMTVLDPQPVKRLGVQRYARHRWMTQGIAPLEADMAANNNNQPVTVDQRNEVSTVPASAQVAEALQVTEGEAVAQRYRKLYDGNGLPTHWLTSWYRVNDVIGTSIMEQNPGTAGRGGGYAVLHERGLSPHTIREDTDPRLPTEHEAGELDIPMTTPVVELWRWVWTDEGRPIEFAHGVHNALHFTWSYTFEVPE